MNARGRAAGFTLVELILAVGLSTVVLIGAFSMLTSMIQYEVEAGRKGSVTGGSLMSLGAMNADIAAASCLVTPPLSGVPGDSLVVCTNWSRQAKQGDPNGNFLDSTSGNTIYSYCYDPANFLIRGMSQSGACPAVGAAPPVCTVAGYPTGTVLATGVYRDKNGSLLFQYDTTTPGAIQLHYVVGNPNAGTVSGPGAGNNQTNFANPVSLAIDTKILMENWTSGN